MADNSEPTITPMKSIMSDARHAALKADIDAALRRHADHLSALDILAVCAQITGMVIAFQDQRAVTSGQAMAIVTANIEAGNAAAIAGMGEAQGRA